jgi:hypothetical protein
VSSNSNSTRLPFTCFASNMLKTFSSIWFICKHVDDFCATCDNHAPMILNIEALCVATYMLNNFSFFCFVCNHIDILAMNCDETSLLHHHYLLLLLMMKMLLRRSPTRLGLDQLQEHVQIYWNNR